MRFLIFSLIIVLVSACTATNSEKNTDEGKMLAETYCGSCHLVPQPDLLDKSSWQQYALPRMGVFLGIVEHDSLRNILVANETERQITDRLGVFPQQPLLSDEEWQKIKAFYIENAPEQPIAPKQKTIKKGQKQFKVVIPDYKLSPPSATFVRINDDQTIYLGDANSQTLSVFSKDLKLQQAARVMEGAVWAEEFPQEMLLTVMGSFSPTDKPDGFILSLPKVANRPSFKVLDSLRRPVHSSYADLNGDGQLDIVTCEFAKWTGKLSWWQGNTDGTFTENILRNKTGAIKAYIKDMNKDGKPDVVSLFGQGDEGIFIHYNKGDGTFREEAALRFPPSYGSSFFQLYDFNNDGHDDIIYAAGDNADFKPILKHYHGVYIYMNDDSNKFSQKYFFPLNGAYAAIPNDFDKDGDIDIAAISFFPNYVNQPEESFVYLENDGNFNFTATTIDDPTLGRWIVMDAGDFDGDGDTDIIIGSLAFEVIPENGLVNKWVQNGIPFIILENTLK